MRFNHDAKPEVYTRLISCLSPTSYLDYFTPELHSQFQLPSTWIPNLNLLLSSILELQARSALTGKQTDGVQWVMRYSRKIAAKWCPLYRPTGSNFECERLL